MPNSSAPIRIGVAGVGAIGRNHARVLSELPDVNFTAIYDPNPKAAKEISESTGAPIASTIEEFVSMVDAATVATPTSTHLEVGGALLRAGKHVLVEKPIAIDAAEAAELVELAHARNLILQVGHIERFNPVMEELEKRLDQPRFIEAHRLSPFPGRSLDIGVVLDLMIHDIEIILHIVGDEVESVDAVGISVHPKSGKTEDIANARIRFRGGCVANVTASRISEERLRKIRVFQGDAYLSLDYANQTGEIHRAAKVGPLIVGVKKEDVKIEKDEPLKRELASFAACAAAGHQPKVSGQEGAAALDLAMVITELIETGEARREFPAS